MVAVIEQVPAVTMVMTPVEASTEQMPAVVEAKLTAPVPEPPVPEIVTVVDEPKVVFEGELDAVKVAWVALLIVMVMLAVATL